MSDVEDDPIERTDEVPNGPIPDGHIHSSASSDQDHDEKGNPFDASLNVIIPEPKTEINTHTIVVGPCSPSDGEITPSGTSGSELPASGTKDNNSSPQNLKS